MNDDPKVTAAEHPEQVIEPVTPDGRDLPVTPEAEQTDPGITDAGIADESPAPPFEHAGSAPASAAPEDAAEPIATVVIVNYNGAHLLGPCLDGLAAQDMPAGSFRSVVVDNASADPSRDLLADEYPWVDLLVSHQNRGFAGGNNFALRHVTTKYAVLLNNDAVPEPGWLRTLLQPLEDDTTGTLVATSSKIVFMPRFVAVEISTEAFRPGGLDPRELGVKIYDVAVDGVQVTDKVLFEKATYGPEGTADDQYRWSRPTGTFHVPVPDRAAPPAADVTGADADGPAERPGIEITLSVAAFADKDVTFTVAGQDFTVTAPSRPGRTSTVTLTLDAATPTVDVVNNVGGIVFVDGSGADRGFQEVDEGQYDSPEEVFTACGNGVAVRSEAGHAVGWFDERYFMYYEDVDLSWRMRAAGGSIRYVPGAVLRHLHSASSTPWSPRWLFHVERNRLLTLTKDASAGRAVRGVARFAATTSKMTARELVAGVRGRRRPQLGQVKVRAKIMTSYLGMLPGLLADRRTLGRDAQVSREELEKWLVTSR